MNKSKELILRAIVTVIAIIIAAILGIIAVIEAPVAPFPGVSGLYLAVAIYIPLSLWMKGWGVVVGYVSCIFVGYNSGLGVVSFYWSLADLFEGLLPLLVFKIAKADVDVGKDLERPNIIYLLMGALVINLIVSAIATASNLSIIWITTLIIAIVILIGLYVLNPTKSWLLYIIFGVFGASFISALFGISGFILAGAPMNTFWTGVLGWFAGDVIVLSAIATPMMVFLTRYIKETSIFVENWF